MTLTTAGGHWQSKTSKNIFRGLLLLWFLRLSTAWILAMSKYYPDFDYFHLANMVIMLSL